LNAFQAGDPVELLQFGKAKPYVATLRAQGKLNVRGHTFAHADLIGREPGCRLTSPEGGEFFLVRPTLARWVESMPRFAKTIYPKDAGPILLHADVFPGARVLEAGLGSAGLSLVLLRALGPEGHLVSYDLRAESLKRGRGNVEAWFGGPSPAHLVREADVYEGIHPDDRDLDRIVLDLPEPWQVVPHLAGALRPGGLLAAFLPTVLQVHQLGEALRDSGAFPDLETFETLQRRWLVGRRSVRPDHAMVGHTGFVTVGRYVPPEPVLEL
jgi:tRNA (adenine57-N1/adenine58-N1)-methyltransferase catalytic subunit